MSDSALIAALAARLRQASENGQAVAPIAAELPAGSRVLGFNYDTGERYLSTVLFQHLEV